MTLEPHDPRLWIHWSTDRRWIYNVHTYFDIYTEFGVLHTKRNVTLARSKSLHSLEIDTSFSTNIRHAQSCYVLISLVSFIIGRLSLRQRFPHLKSLGNNTYFTSPATFWIFLYSSAISNSGLFLPQHSFSSTSWFFKIIINSYINFHRVNFCNIPIPTIRMIGRLYVVLVASFSLLR
jgi:hypothetical protein